jgi:hypothetical protein
MKDIEGKLFRNVKLSIACLNESIEDEEMKEVIKKDQMLIDCFNGAYKHTYELYKYLSEKLESK